MFGGTAMPGASGGVLGVMEMQPRWEWLALREHAVTGPKGEKQLHEEDTMKPLRPL